MREQIENTVLGAALKNNEFIYEVELTPNMFASPKAKHLWETITESVNSGKPVDAMSLINNEKLFEFASQCVTNHYSDAMAKSFAVKLREMAIADHIKAIGQQLVEDPNYAEEATKELMSIHANAHPEFSMHIKGTLTAAIQHIDDVANGKVKAISTGLERLDQVIGGYHDSDLIVIAARPGMGKTSFVLNSLMRCKAHAGLFSAEMGHRQVGERILCSQAKVRSEKLRQGRMKDADYSKLLAAVNTSKEMPIWINDQPAPTLSEIASQARKWKLEQGIQIIFIDYLQRIKLNGNDPRHEKVGEAARTLKELARELEIPIVVLGQVNRAAEGIRPNMSHLAQSGEIEAEADQILFLYREKETPNIAEVLIGKNRHGQICGIQVAWDAQHMTFNNLVYGDDYA